MFTRRQFSSSLLATTALGATRTAFGKIITGFPAAQSLRNIDYLGRCYNIVEVDPLTFKPYKPKTVVDFAFKAGHTSPDGRFQLPDNVAYFSERTGTYREDQTIISSSSDFQRAVSESATISGSGSDGVKSASFSASASYSNYSREAQSKDTFSTLTSTSTPTIGSISNGTSQVFLSALKSLKPSPRSQPVQAALTLTS
jgi:hypothetical protein